ncbi:MAG TPA: hypothetical protein VKE70_03515, partial [Candidatus Solibacter sp.]|nr:hypothetical protein [Candidatus Solibacter sp.]
MFQGVNHPIYIIARCMPPREIKFASVVFITYTGRGCVYPPAIFDFQFPIAAITETSATYMFGKSIRKPGGFKALLILALFSIWAQEGFSPAQESSFSRTLYPVLEKAACRSCHNPDGVASATRLHFPTPDANADQIEAFGR